MMRRWLHYNTGVCTRESFIKNSKVFVHSRLIFVVFVEVCELCTNVVVVLLSAYSCYKTTTHKTVPCPLYPWRRFCFLIRRGMPEWCCTRMGLEIWVGCLSSLTFLGLYWVDDPNNCTVLAPSCRIHRCISPKSFRKWEVENDFETFAFHKCFCLSSLLSVGWLVLFLVWNIPNVSWELRARLCTNLSDHSDN